MIYEGLETDVNVREMRRPPWAIWDTWSGAVGVI